MSGTIKHIENPLISFTRKNNTQSRSPGSRHTRSASRSPQSKLYFDPSKYKPHANDKGTPIINYGDSTIRVPDKDRYSGTYSCSFIVLRNKRPTGKFIEFGIVRLGKINYDTMISRDKKTIDPENQPAIDNLFPHYLIHRSSGTRTYDVEKILN